MNTPQLIDLFNQGFDFAKLQKDGTYVGVEWPCDASHHLNATVWDTEANKTPSERWRTPVPGQARAVCAVPIKRVFRAAKFAVKKALPKSPKNWPPYKTDLAESGKRKVLLKYVALCGVYRKFAAKIRKMSSVECDAFLKEIVKASRYCRSKLKKDPATQAYWERRKAELAAKTPKAAPSKRSKPSGLAAQPKNPLPPSKSLAFSLEGKFEESHKQAARDFYRAVVAYKQDPTKKTAKAKYLAECDFIKAVPVLKDRMQLGVIIRKEEGALGATYTTEGK